MIYIIMAQVTHNGKNFTIPDEIQAQYDELVKMILATESMDDDERQYWFDIMPSMTDEQIDRLYNILDTERKKLQDLEKKYQAEIKQLNEKHLIEWQNYQMKDSKKKIADEEAKDKDEDAEDVLKMLNTL
ncbi:hypothetical protein MK079_01115 [Candidatus Gracilibacteria bacterium]|nr:hypothetical protein [Candidatus Gracilibacteria bacterium]